MTSSVDFITDTKPIYLGFDPLREKYYFYIIKDQVPRFLVYAGYFFLDRGPQDILELKEIPEDILVELHQYLTRKIGYEFVKRRKNSKISDPHKVFLPTPYDGGSPSAPDSGLGLRGNGGVPSTEKIRGVVESRRRTPSPSIPRLKEKVEVPVPIVVQTPVEAPKKRGRPPKLKPAIESNLNEPQQRKRSKKS
jgi:hypothetical protein